MPGVLTGAPKAPFTITFGSQSSSTCDLAFLVTGAGDGAFNTTHVFISSSLPFEAVLAFYEVHPVRFAQGLCSHLLPCESFSSDTHLQLGRLVWRGLPPLTLPSPVCTFPKISFRFTLQIPPPKAISVNTAWLPPVWHRSNSERGTQGLS